MNGRMMNERMNGYGCVWQPGERKADLEEKNALKKAKTYTVSKENVMCSQNL